jgi:hypothetical protein
LLDTILQLGFDPSGMNSPLFQQWPSPCSPNWGSEELTPDPFFHEYLAALVKNNQGNNDFAYLPPHLLRLQSILGFGGSTPLQDAVLRGETAIVQRLLPKVTNPDSHRNFLGQTPLHLAVCNLQISTFLLDAGHDIDTKDRWGITPLMYAAALGVSEVVQLLIIRGANTITRATQWNRDFMHYASVRGHWDLILESLCSIRLCYREKTYQHYVKKAILHLVVEDTWLGDAKNKYYESLLELCEDVNFTFNDLDQGKDNQNLLHYVRNDRELHALLRHGFHGFNTPNSDGELPVFSIVDRTSDFNLIRSCIDNGTDIHRIDQSDRTVIFKLLPRLHMLGFTTWDTIDSIKLCLHRGLDVFYADSCRCPCSMNGCHTSTAFNVNFKPKFLRDQPDFIWAFEWLSIIEEFCGYEASKEMLLSFIRRVRFDMLKMTHICCHRGKGLGKTWNFDHHHDFIDIGKILEEERTMIEALEAEMQRHTSESLDTLKCEFMGILKKVYDGALENCQEQMKETNSTPVSHQATEKNWNSLV